MFGLLRMCSNHAFEVGFVDTERFSKEVLEDFIDVFGHFTTSQWPPFCGPMCFKRPSLTSLALALSTALKDLPIVAAISISVMFGFASNSWRIFTGVFTGVS